MDRLKFFLSSQLAWVVEVMITVAIFFTNLMFSDLYKEIAVSITTLLMIVVVYALYGIFFYNTKRTAYIFLLFNAILSIIFANKLYLYSNLLEAFPVIGKINKGVWVFSVFVIFTLAFGLIKVSQQLKKIEKEEVIQTELKAQTYNNAQKGNDCHSGEDIIADKCSDDPRYVQEKNLMATSTFYYVISVISMLLIIVAISLYVIAKINGNTLENLNANPIEKATALFAYGISILMVSFVVVAGLLILLMFSKYLIRKILEFVNELKNPPKRGNESVPIYVLSIFVVLTIFYISYKFGDFTIDDFTDIAIDGRYLAYPLLLILGIAVFTLLLWIVHGMIVLISTVNAQNLKEKFKNLEESIHLIKNCGEITKATFDFVFSTIFSVLSFLSFIPVYFISMADLVGVPILFERDNQKEADKVTMKEVDSNEKQ